MAEILASAHLPPLLGWLPRDAAIALAERHLGLVLPTDQTGQDVAYASRLATALRVDPERLLSVVAQAALQTRLDGAFDAGVSDGNTFETTDHIHPAEHDPLLKGQVVAVARDRAFCFLYEANLAWLKAMGAQVCFFSPLAGDSLPGGTTAVWLPGGYPELHGEALAGSATWSDLARFAGKGGAVLAECGGMMALGRSLLDLEGRHWPMAGVLPIDTCMTGRLAGLGYRQERGGLRGHEFHHSIRQGGDGSEPAFTVEKGDAGVRWRNVRASYIHWYFPSAPDQVAAWLASGEKA
ncbi:MAG: hypothetical protein HQL62_07200 [Magnetococcales bacterium]|nr:hypothetical protein [Magnetococcales bacterium]